MRYIAFAVALGLSLVAVSASPAAAADKAHQQLMAEIRMLQEQQQQLQQLVGGLAETLKVVTSKIDDQTGGNRSVQFRLIGTQSNRDAIGATVRIYHAGTSQSRMVRSGSSYLSQSELPVTFGVGKRDVIDRVTIAWPNGRAEEFTKVAAGKQYDCVEGKGISESSR